jgi:Rieske Fe-S protein
MKIWSRRAFLRGSLSITSLAVLAACTKKAAPSGIDSLAPGQGAVIELDGEQVAVYKDSSGQVIRLSPLCPHQGCTVQWDASSSIWACPCHNSRFEPDGTRISGPAGEGLQKLD